MVGGLVALDSSLVFWWCNVLTRMKACEDRQRGDSSEVRGPNVRSGKAVHKGIAKAGWYTALVHQVKAGVIH